MGKSLTLGTLLGAIVLFIWMGFSWMVLPWHCATLKKFSDEKSVAAIFTANTTESGVYLLPYICGKEAENPSFNEGPYLGPMVFSAVRRSGYDFSSSRPYIVSAIIYLIGALFVTSLLLQRKETTFWKRVAFVTTFGVTAGILCAFPQWNWWGFSFSFAFIEFLDFAIGWFFAGLVLAAVTKRSEPFLKT